MNMNRRSITRKEAYASIEVTCLWYSRIISRGLTNYSICRKEWPYIINDKVK